MIVSYKWLQTYFKEKLPTPEKVAEAFTFGAFEVEGSEKINDDVAIDLKVLPDRACYALSHRGIAYELSAILNQKSSVDFDNGKLDDETIGTDEKVSVTVKEKKLCQRYCARYVKNISVSTSPVSLREMLNAVGQRSINSIVDATNYVMLDIGQPLHAFDADKVEGGIVVRLAKDDETIELLPEKGSNTNRIITLRNTDLVITDDKGPIAIAGVKGGFRAAVTAETKNLILESANFDAASIRRTSNRLALRNDASKRFENNLSLSLAPQAMVAVSNLLKKLSPHAVFGEVTDAFSWEIKEKKIDISPDFISARLGTKFSPAEMEGIFSRLQIDWASKGNGYELTVPKLRLDLNIREDIVEEVGRIYGYENVAPLIPQKLSKEIPVNHFAYWIEKIKDVLFENGFSEVQTSSFGQNGEVEILNPMASDKKFLRTNLTENILNSLDLNGKNAALFGSDEVNIFEIGTVFTAEGEHVALGLGCVITKNLKKKEQIISEKVDKILANLSDALGVKMESVKNSKDGSVVCEINLTDLMSKLSNPSQWDIKTSNKENKYVPFSVYPFMVRDVAVFAPKSASEKDVASVITSATGPLLIRLDLFDVFVKKFENGEEKTSYAFHLVFQSRERTLVEEEINEIMKKVSEVLAAKSWQVR